MAQPARTTSAASDTLLDTATLLLAGLTALVVILRHEADHPAAAPQAAVTRPAFAPAVTGAAEAEAERQALYRDMLLHD